MLFCSSFFSRPRSFNMHARRFFALLAALGAAGMVVHHLAAQSAQQPSLRPTVYAIRDARVIAEPGKELAKATIVIRDGLIDQVGENVKRPAGAIVIDGTGRTVYAGFIDATSHWGIDLTLRRSEAGPAEAVDYASEALAVTKADNRKGVTPEFETATALKMEE